MESESRMGISNVHTYSLDKPRGRHTPYLAPQSPPSTCTPIQRSIFTLPLPTSSFPYYLTPSLFIFKSSEIQNPKHLPLFLRFRSFSKIASSAIQCSSLSTNQLVRSISAGSTLLISSCSSFSLRSSQRKSGGNIVAAAASVDANSMPLTGVVFQPFEEVKKADLAVPVSNQTSLARQRYADECEAIINEQINVEYNVSIVYHAMYAYFDRDNVALKGLAKFFKESSEEERQHAEKLMEYQNKRGGKVKLHSIVAPISEFEHVEKGDALYAMELALSLEKLVNEKLLNLHSVAGKNNDPQLADFIESEFLGEQVEAIKKISDYVTQLRMIGKGHGVWHFDQKLQ